MAHLELRGVCKRYDAAVAVNGVTLEVSDGEFLTLLGPSGCGKTTTLRIIAGLVEPDEGEVLLDGQPIQHLPPHRRETAMVFQSYALFPHMTVEQNIGFGLRMRREESDTIKVRVKEVLDLVELRGLEARYPRQLSGGQQQRVAVARAVVTRPKVLLFDEPLSNLDAKLRERLRVELRALQQRLRVTTVYVTHDQAEALALSDRVAIMFDGSIVEVGTPREVYHKPQSRPTAEFLGIANLLKGRILSLIGNECIVETSLGNLRVSTTDSLHPGDEVTLSFRPENIQIGEGDGVVIPGRVTQATYLGSIIDYQVDVVGVPLRVHKPGNTACHPVGAKVTLTLPRDAAIIREN